MEKTLSSGVTQLILLKKSLYVCAVRVLCVCCVCAVRACAHAVALVEARGQLLRAGFPSAMSGSGGGGLPYWFLLLYHILRQTGP